MKISKNVSVFVVGFALVASLFAGGCSSKKSIADDSTAVDTSAMQATEVASNSANLGKTSSGRAR